MPFDPDAYLSEDKGFDPDAYLQKPEAPVSKESFLGKVGRYTDAMIGPDTGMGHLVKDILSVPMSEKITRPIFAPVTKKIEQLQGAIASSPTAEALAAPFKTALSVGKFFSEGLGEGGIGVADALPLAPKAIKPFITPAKTLRAQELAQFKPVTEATMGTIGARIPKEQASALQHLKSQLPTGFPEGTPTPPVIPNKLSPVFRSELERAPTLKKGIVVDPETRAYNQEQFKNYINKTIKGDTIPLTHETTGDVVEKILKGSELGAPNDGRVFASMGHLSKPDFVKKGYRIYLDVPKKDLDYIGIDTMDHPGAYGDFKGHKSHVAVQVNNSHIREIVDAEGNVVYRNLKPGVTPPSQPVAQGIKPAVTESPVQKLQRILSGATDIRKQQDVMYSLERAKRAETVGGIQASMPGKEGYLAQRAALKGELEKADLKSIAEYFTPEDEDALINMIRTSEKLPHPMDKFDATEALLNLLGNKGVKLPGKAQLAKLSQVFPPDLIDTLLKKRPLMEQVWEASGNVLNVPRTMMSTLDMSIPLRQGLVLAPHSPKRFMQAFGNMFKYAFSEDAYETLLKDIQSRPTYSLMRDNGLSLTGVGELAPREESFASNLAEKLPFFGGLVKASNRAASGFLNKLRVDVFDDLVKSANAAGVTKENPTVVKNIAGFINNATGRGGLSPSFEKASEILNATFFSPRLMASRFNLLNPFYYTRLDPFTRKEALKAMGGLVSGGMSVLALADAAGAEVGLDPRSADFGKIKIGNTRYDIWGGFQQYAVLLSRLATQEMVSSTTGKEFQLGEGYKATTGADIVQRFFESKTSPLGSLAIGALRGKTALGEDFEMAPEIVDRFIPMMLQDFRDLSRDRDFPLAVGMTMPGFFGVGSQTYADEVPVKELNKYTGEEKVRWRQAPSIGESVVNWYNDKELSNIPQSEWPGLLKKKKEETQTRLSLEKVRARVLETGVPERVGDKLVYLQSGVVRTKDVGVETKQEKVTKKVESATKSVSAELYNLGIPVKATPEIAYRISRIMADKRYKSLRPEQKKALINRTILSRGQ